MRTLTILMLAVLLSACNLFGGPNLDVVRRAIAYQVETSQQQLSPQFFTNPRTVPFKVKRIRVSETEPIRINDQAAFHVVGRYDIQFRSTLRPAPQVGNAFDVYVIQNREDERWWLARPDSTPGMAEWTFVPLS